MSILNTYFSSIKISYLNIKMEYQKIAKHEKSSNLNTNEMKNKKEDLKDNIINKY